MPQPPNNLQQKKQNLIALVKKKAQRLKQELAKRRLLEQIVGPERELSDEELLGPEEEQKPAEPPKE